MKYADLTWGTMEAVVNKLGGMDGVRRFLNGELSLDIPQFAIWKTIKLGTELKTADDFREALGVHGMKIGSWGNDILGKPAFTASVAEVEVDLVNVPSANSAFQKEQNARTSTNEPYRSVWSSVRTKSVRNCVYSTRTSPWENGFASPWIQLLTRVATCRCSGWGMTTVSVSSMAALVIPATSGMPRAAGCLSVASSSPLGLDTWLSLDLVFRPLQRFEKKQNSSPAQQCVGLLSCL